MSSRNSEKGTVWSISAGRSGIDIPVNKHATYRPFCASYCKDADSRNQGGNLKVCEEDSQRWRKYLDCTWGGIETRKDIRPVLADWSIIRYLRENLPEETVLFANGNILRTEDINRCLEATGADAVMSAEGNLYDPAIFGEVPPIGEEGREYWRGKDGKGGYRMDAVFRRYMDILYKYVLQIPPPVRKPLFIPSDSRPVLEASAEESNTNDADGQPPKKKQKRDKKEKTTSPNLIAMQPHLFHLLRPLVSKHHHIRDALARCKAGDIAAFEDVLQKVEAVTRDALVEYEATDGKSIEADYKNPPAAPATSEKDNP